MVQSQQVLEWQAESRADALLRVLKWRLPEVPEEVASQIRATTDLARLDQWIDAAAVATSLNDFRQATGL